MSLLMPVQVIRFPDGFGITLKDHNELEVRVSPFTYPNEAAAKKELARFFRFLADSYEEQLGPR